MALGVMAGITAMHHYQVGELVERGGLDARLTQPAPQIAALVPQVQRAPVQLAVSDVPAARKPVASFQPGRTDREDALLELLAEMRKEQKMMHKQMAEQNREVAELTFRVDTHSDSFKPMKTDSRLPRSLDRSSPQTPIGDGDSLLTPVPASVPRR